MKWLHSVGYPHAINACQGALRTRTDLAVDISQAQADPRRSMILLQARMVIQTRSKTRALSARNEQRSDRQIPFPDPPTADIALRHWSWPPDDPSLLPPLAPVAVPLESDGCQSHANQPSVPDPDPQIEYLPVDDDNDRERFEGIDACRATHRIWLSVLLPFLGVVYSLLNPVRSPGLDLAPPCHAAGNPNFIVPMAHMENVTMSLGAIGLQFESVIAGTMTVQPKDYVPPFRPGDWAHLNNHCQQLREDLLTQHMSIFHAIQCSDYRLLSHYRSQLDHYYRRSKWIWRVAFRYLASIIHDYFLQHLEKLDYNLHQDLPERLTRLDNGLVELQSTCVDPLKDFLYSVLGDIAKEADKSPHGFTKYEFDLLNLREIEGYLSILDATVYILTNLSVATRNLLDPLDYHLATQIANIFNVTSSHLDLPQSKLNISMLHNILPLHHEYLARNKTLRPYIAGIRKCGEADRIAFRWSMDYSVHLAHMWSLQRFEYATAKERTRNSAGFVPSNVSIGCSTQPSAFWRWWFFDWKQGVSLSPRRAFEPDSFSSRYYDYGPIWARRFNRHRVGLPYADFSNRRKRQ